MKCSRCGEECDENQAFCLKCGSPIQVVPDLNEIEAKLADDIGEMMNEMNEENGKEKEYDDGFGNDVEYNGPQEDVKYEDLNLELKVMDLAHKQKTEEQELIMLDSEEEEDEDDGSEELEKPKMSKKKKIIIGVSIGAAALIIIISIVLIIVLGKSDKFTKYYNNANQEFEDKSYDDALEEVENAMNAADTDSEKIKALELMAKIYEAVGDSDNKLIDIYTRLIKLDDSNVKYYESLGDLYYKNEEFSKLNELIASIDDKDIKEALGKYQADTPKASPAGGEYTTYQKITLTASAGSTIYYTTNGDIPDIHSDIYKEPIELNEEKEYTISAIAIDGEGAASSVVTETYTIKLKLPDEPTVKPDSGKYSESQKIEINVPSDCKAYYTTDGSIPTKDSEEYKEAIDMPRGTIVFKAIIIDSNGLVSQVKEMAYSLVIERKLSVNDAKSKVEQYMLDENIIINDNGDTSDGNNISAKYAETVIVDNNEYFIIIATKSDSLGNVVGATCYGIDTVKGDIVKMDPVGDNEYSIIE